MCLCAPFLSNAQEAALKKADSLWSAKEYYRAALEYERVVYQDYSDSLSWACLLKKAYCYKALINYEDAYYTLSRIATWPLSQELKTEVYYERMLTAYLSKQYAQVELEALGYKMEVPDTNITNKVMFLEVLALNEQMRWQEAREKFRAYLKWKKSDIDPEPLYCFADKPRLKSERKAEVLATFIPGAGIVYAGKTGRGILNFTLVAASLAFGAYNVLEEFYATALFSGFGLGYVFYTGGQRQTFRLIELKNQQIKEGYNSKIRKVVLELEQQP